jgi:hypothetical protein
MNKEVVLLLTVVLDQGQEVIQVKADDQPHQVAQDFCKAKGLDESMIDTMTQFIQQQLHPPRRRRVLSTNEGPKPSRKEVMSSRSSSAKTITKSRTSGRELPAEQENRPQVSRPASASKVDDSSQLMLKSIFKQLKPTRKGTLTYATITRANLTDRQAAFLRPLFEKLVTTEKQIGFEEFCDDLTYLQKAKHVNNLLKLFPKPAHQSGSVRPRSRQSSSVRLSESQPLDSKYQALMAIHRSTGPRSSNKPSRRVSRRHISRC